MPLRVEGVCRAHPAETVCGDAWQADWHDGVCRITVVDGLGHGPEAAASAEAALRALRQQPALAPSEAIHTCHAALAGLRGAAISVVTVSADSRSLEYAGVGNVEGRVRARSRWERFAPFRGIVGVTMRSVRSFTFALEPGWALVLHSDGVSSRFDELALDDLLQQGPRAAATDLIDTWGRATDDATAVVALDT